MMRSKRAYREGIGQFFKDLRPQFFVTLIPNRDPLSTPQSTLNALKRPLRHFNAMLDRRMHGKRWAQFPSSKRIEGIWYAEHLDTNPHLHGAVILPPEASLDWQQNFPEIASSVWQSIHPAHEAKIMPVYGSMSLAEYMTKEAPDSSFVLASEFHPH